MAESEAAAGPAKLKAVQLLSDSYAMQAALRAQRRRLCDMARLLDYMLSDAVHSMLVFSMQHMLRCLHGTSEQQLQQLLPPSEQQGGLGQQVVLRLELLLHQQQGGQGGPDLVLQPQACEFMEGLAVWLRGLERLVRGLPRLLSAPQLKVRWLPVFWWGVVVFYLSVWPLVAERQSLLTVRV